MKVSAPPISTAPTSSSPVEGPKNNGQAKGKDKDKKDKPEPVAAASPPPAPLPLPASGGLSMKAVLDSQAERRAEERAEAAELKAKSRTVAPPQVATDGSVEALSLVQGAVKNAEANRIASEKAAEAKRAEAERSEPRFPAQTEERSDPFSAEPEEASREAKPSLGFQAYQSSYAPPQDSGSNLDARF